MVLNLRETPISLIFHLQFGHFSANKSALSKNIEITKTLTEQYFECARVSFNENISLI
jgi:hypothetical protein